MEKSCEQEISFDTSCCIHCGLCLQACPTYVETGHEAHSPRGRIYALKAIAEGRATWEDVAKQLDSCLGCLACETACPSQVPYEKMISNARAVLERKRPLPIRVARRALIGVLQNPSNAAAALNLIAIPGMSILAKLLLRGGPLPRARSKQSTSFLPGKGKRRGEVALLAGCIQRVALPEVNAAAAACFNANGFDVIVLETPECCGALSAHHGYPWLAESLAAKVLRHTPSGIPLITTAAGCGAYLKRTCKSFETEIFDFAEFLHVSGWVAPLAPRPEMRIALHDPCHLEHAQGIKDSPRRLLSLIPGAVILELDEDYCCGSAGLYSVFQPNMAKRLLRRKLDAILRTGANIVLSSNVGCTLWLRHGIEKERLPLRVLHLAEIMQLGLSGKVH